MLNIEVIKFEAQDVITASACAVHKKGDEFTVAIGNPLDPTTFTFTCNKCDTAFAGKAEGGEIVPDFTKKK